MRHLPSAAILLISTCVCAQSPIDLGSRRELFVDDFLIDKLDNVRLELQVMLTQTERSSSFD